MARNDIQVLTPTSLLYASRWIVSAGANYTTGGVMGDPFYSVLATASQTGIVKACADGAGVIGTTAATNGRFVGIAKNDSTQTAAAAGYVYTWTPLPGMVYGGRAKTSSTFDTQAEIDALRGSAVFFDSTSNIYTVDCAATDAAANALVIIDGDYKSKYVHFYVKMGWSVLNSESTLS